MLDLDETLIHFNEEEDYFAVRPGCQDFLKHLSAHFEIVIFTASVQEYADWIIDQIDTEGHITHRLY